MLPIVYAGILASVASLYVLLTSNMINLADEQDALLIEGSVRVISRAVDSYYEDTRRFPPSLDFLQTQSGYEYVRSYRSPYVGYQVSGTINDGVWSYNRAVVYGQYRKFRTPDSIYLGAANNACGTGGQTTALNWCGSNRSLWFKRESRELYAHEIGLVREHLNRMIQRLGNYYRAANSFPNRKSDGTDMTDGQAATLRDIVGHNPSGASTWRERAAACNGRFEFDGMPIECADLYIGAWAVPVTYNYYNKDSIEIGVIAPFRDGASNPIIISQQITAN